VYQIAELQRQVSHCGALRLGKGKAACFDFGGLHDEIGHDTENLDGVVCAEADELENLADVLGCDGGIENEGKVACRRPEDHPLARELRLGRHRVRPEREEQRK
jgi:hypothetical protein